MRELVQNWRDGLLQLARLLRPGTLFSSLRCVADAPSRPGASVTVRVYLNGGPGADWVAPVRELGWYRRDHQSGEVLLLTRHGSRRKGATAGRVRQVEQ